jgi:tryptophan-rich sensory protein
MAYVHRHSWQTYQLVAYKETVMLASLNQPTRPALARNIATALLAIFLTNGLIFGLGWDNAEEQTRLTFEPPGYVIGIIWIVLFTLLAIARWHLNAPDDKATKRTRAWVTGLLAFNLLYPFYSLAVDSLVGGLLGNLCVIAIALIATVSAWRNNRTAALLVSPVVAWVSFATVIVVTKFVQL